MEDPTPRTTSKAAPSTVIDSSTALEPETESERLLTLSTVSVVSVTSLKATASARVGDRSASVAAEAISFFTPLEIGRGLSIALYDCLSIVSAIA